jgi:hypothetical protein
VIARCFDARCGQIHAIGNRISEKPSPQMPNAVNASAVATRRQ